MAEIATKSKFFMNIFTKYSPAGKAAYLAKRTRLTMNPANTLIMDTI